MTRTGARKSVALRDDRPANGARAGLPPDAARTRKALPPSRPGGGRKPRLVLLGLGMVLACAALGGEVAARSSQLTGYLGLRFPLAYGQLLRAADLSRVEMRLGGSVDAISLSRAREYLGRVAASDLPAGTLLVPQDFLAGTTPARRMAIVGADLQSDQAPGNLAVGDRVWAISARQSGPSGGPGGTALLARGTVFGLGAGASGAGSSGVEVDLEVPLRDGPAVAGASAAGDLSLIEVPASLSGRQARSGS